VNFFCYVKPVLTFIHQEACMESSNCRSWLYGLVAMVAIAIAMLFFTGHLPWGQ